MRGRGRTQVYCPRGGTTRTCVDPVDLITELCARRVHQVYSVRVAGGG